MVMLVLFALVSVEDGRAWGRERGEGDGRRRTGESRYVRYAGMVWWHSVLCGMNETVLRSGAGVAWFVWKRDW